MKDKFLLTGVYPEFLKYTPDTSLNTSIRKIDEISEILQNGGNCTIMRFNDGEWSFAYQIQPYVKNRIKAAHDRVPGAELCLSYSGRLLRMVVDSKPEYMVSIDSQSIVRRPYSEFVKKHMHKFKNLIGGGVFNIWSMYTGFGDLFKILRGRKVLIVGPEYLKGLPIEADHITLDAQRAVYDTQKWAWEVIRYLDKNYEPDMVIIYSCGFIAKVAINEIYKIHGESITQLDMGASLNPFVGRSNRPWHSQMIEELKHIDKK